MLNLKPSPYTYIRRVAPDGRCGLGYIGENVSKHPWVGIYVKEGDPEPAEIPANYRGFVSVPWGAVGADLKPGDVFALGARFWRVVSYEAYADRYVCVLDYPGSQIVVWAYQLRWKATFKFWNVLHKLKWVQQPQDSGLVHRPAWRYIRPFGIGMRKNAR